MGYYIYILTRESLLLVANSLAFCRLRSGLDKDNPFMAATNRGPGFGGLFPLAAFSKCLRRIWEAGLVCLWNAWQLPELCDTCCNGAVTVFMTSGADWVLLLRLRRLESLFRPALAALLVSSRRAKSRVWMASLLNAWCTEEFSTKYLELATSVILLASGLVSVTASMRSTLVLIASTGPVKTKQKRGGHTSLDTKNDISIMAALLWYSMALKLVYVSQELETSQKIEHNVIK